MSNNTQEREFTQPLFKFLEEQYFESFMRGYIHISNVLRFRKESNSEDLIDDIREGEQTFHRGIRGFPPVIVDRTKRNDVFIFCATKSILSDSLRWAINSKRLTCCLIVSPRKVFDEVSSSKELKFIRRGDCNYRCRDAVTFLPITVDEELEKRSLFIKPLKYKDQLEHRVCWDGLSTNGAEGLTIRTNSPSKLIRVDLEIPEVLKSQLQYGIGKIESVKITVHFVGTHRCAVAHMPYDQDLFTPIVYNDTDGSENIGFRNPCMTLVNSHIDGGGVAKLGCMTDPQIGMLVLCCEVNKISRIEYLIT